jgi:hypothetical protein
MAEDNGRQHIEQDKVRQVDHHAANHTMALAGTVGPESTAAYSGGLLGDARLSGRGNAPVRAAMMQRAQQTYGNRAVQRFLHRSQLTPRTPLQREDAPPDPASQPQGQGQDQGQNQSDPPPGKLASVEGTIEKVKGEPAPGNGGCDGPETAPSGASNSIAYSHGGRPGNLDAQFGTVASVQEGMGAEADGTWGADRISSSLTAKSTVSFGGVHIEPGAFGYAQPAFSFENINWKAEGGKVNVKATFNTECKWIVGAPGGQQSVSSATDDIVTANSWDKIVQDLTPKDGGRPARTSYWAKDITMKHEKFHVDEYIERAKVMLPIGQMLLNIHDIGVPWWLDRSDKARIDSEVRAQIEVIRQFLEMNVRVYYEAGGEDRAYGGGIGDYSALVESIKARATAEKWKPNLTPDGQPIPPKRGGGGGRPPGLAKGASARPPVQRRSKFAGEGESAQPNKEASEV